IICTKNTPSVSKISLPLQRHVTLYSFWGQNVLTFGDKMSLFPSNKGGWSPKFRKAAGGGKVPNLAKANF
ncbi:hypothetical protein, partial [Phascolarctobacterium succinatutens]|uniref:hypothetical protein n=1 Tax=Phascolarctobacterium succinatutens TaxID=626940 RepID=UPI0026DC1979